MKKIVSAALVGGMCLAGCVSSGSDVKSIKGEAQVDKFSVTWGAIPVFKDRVPKGTTPLIFTFTSLSPASNNGVTEQDWLRESEKTGMSVSDLKSVVYGGSAYKGPNGDLRVCTIHAIQQGFCGEKLGLSVAKRAEYARRALKQNSRCQWIGFDPSYNALASHMAGAETFTLHVAAKCE